MDKSKNENYIVAKSPEKEYKAYSWNTAIGLQDVDGLKVSSYLLDTAKKQINDEISMDSAKEALASYYSQKEIHLDRNAEADLVSANIAEILQEEGFVFSVAQFTSIHKRLFENVFSHAGQIRDFNISKAEWILDGETVLYGNAPELKALLNYDFEQEKNFSYKGLTKDQIIKHLARFTANLWQIHPFAEGNTRTVAVFLIKYLKMLGFNVTNDTLAKNAWYFRNALVRANYTSISKGTYETTEYLEKILRDLVQYPAYDPNPVGRPPKDLPSNWDEVIAEWKAGYITANEAMKKTNMKRTSFYKYVK